MPIVDNEKYLQIRRFKAITTSKQANNLVFSKSKKDTQVTTK